MNSSVKQFAKTVTPNRLYLRLEKFYRIYSDFVFYNILAKKARYFGRSHYCPICRSHFGKFLPYGVMKRQSALCPVCGSLERHRLCWLFIQQKTNLLLPPKKRMLHVAPEDCLKGILQKNEYIDYVCSDLTPYTMLQMDLESICFPDETFDVIYASHVLEHIIDDREAIREIHRVLKTNGWAILQVPINSHVTFEDSSIFDPLKRERIFGGCDHVRNYGKDYYDRLRAAGFKVKKLNLPDQLNQSTAYRFGLSQGEEITLCTKAQ